MSASDLAKQLKTNGDTAASHSALDLPWFYQQVRNKAPWDYKQNGRAYEDFGNYNFGYTGTRQGIPGEVLLEGAGMAQLAAGTSSWSFVRSNWDNPKDQEQIRRGISDAKNSAIRMVSAIAMAVPIAGCGSVCSSDTVGIFRAEGSPYVAQLNKKDCGATTRYAYELFLSKVGEKDADLVLRFDDNGNKSWPEDERRLVRLQLAKPNTLKVHVTEPVRVFKQEDKAAGLAVSYEFEPGTKIM